MKKLHGIISAAVTPFDKSGEIIESGYQENIEFVIRNGVHGIVLLATAGEAPSLSFQEKKRVIELGLQANRGRVVGLVGVGGTNARETFDLIDYAESAGADGLFVITPYFYRFGRDEYLAYFREISRRSKTQILIYNSTYANCPLDPQALAELSTLPNVTALKEGNPLQVVEVMRLTDGQLRVFTARDVYLYQTMAMGGAGGIFFSANVAPKLCVELYEHLVAERYAQARELQFKLSPLVMELVARSYPAGIKAALNLLGLGGGHVRFPLSDYDANEIAHLHHVMLELGLL